MAPWQLLIWLVVGVGLGIAGWAIGKDKGRPTAGWWLGFLLGLIGLIIIACLPRTREAEAQRQYLIQAEAARRAGYPYLPQQPYAPYPPPSQGPYPQQPGQWLPPPPPQGSWEQPPPGQWPGPQQ
jgi:hypothetical protein